MTGTADSRWVRVEPQRAAQRFEGWGTSLCWWAHAIGNWRDQAAAGELLDLLFRPGKGLGLNIVRYNIGGGEKPGPDTLRPGGAVPGFSPAPGEFEPEADAGQRRVLLGALERGVDLAEAFSNSPPHWMTQSGSVTGAADGGNNLRSDMEDAFADYLTEVVRLYRDRYGVWFRTLNPLNEPASPWWVQGNSQEGCHFDAPAQNRILRKTGQLLARKALMQTQVSAPDENSFEETLASVRVYDAEVLEGIRQINTHSYHGRDRAGARELARSLGKRLWMSEYGVGVGRHDHEAMASALVLARTILSDLNQLGAEAWIYWQVVENEGQHHNWGCVHANFSGSEQYWLTRQYHVLNQFCRVVCPGCTVVATDDVDTLAAWDERQRCLGLVIVNDTDSARQAGYDLTRLGTARAPAECWRTSDEESCRELERLDVAEGRVQLTLKEHSVTSLRIQL